MRRTIRAAAKSAGILALAALAPWAEAGADPGPVGETRDVLMMLDSGPVHLRFHIALGGAPLPRIRQEYIDRLITSLDQDGDGTVSRKEARNSPLLATVRRDRAAEFLASLEENRTVSREEIHKTVERVGGETVVYRQDESAAENDLEVFKFLDADGNGVIEREEMALADAKIMDRDLDGDEVVGFTEFLPEPEPEVDPQLVAVMPEVDERERPKPTISYLLRDTNEPFLPSRLVRKYDRNRDGKLTAKELRWADERVAGLDRNGDGKLDPNELNAVPSSPVDMEVAVDLGGGEESPPRLTVISIAGERLDEGRRRDFARLNFGGTSVTVSIRNIDPMKVATDNAMREFNRMDLDANGYLDSEETSARIRFGRGLFPAIDADGDGKIFGEEMERYVRLRAEPAATTCQVNIYDTGFGFFQTLDGNGDGRISIRETRTVMDSLQAMMRSGKSALAPTDPARHFHIEFVRGSYQLFGRSERMISQTPSFVERPSTGPIWFQRMDRNGDSDLTWKEFLGPRDVFYQLDQDKDGLIDPVEAEAAGEESS